MGDLHVPLQQTILKTQTLLSWKVFENNVPVVFIE